MDDPGIEENNVEERVEEFLKRVDETRVYYSAGRRHIMYTMGDDFQYEAAGHNFRNLDKLIYHMNNVTDETGVNLLYSTPSCYAMALNRDGDGEEQDDWQTKTDDFFPYCDGSGTLFH